MSETVQGNWEAAVDWLRNQPGCEQIVRDAYYDDPLASAAERFWSSNEWQAVRAILGNGPGRALDVGAGRGIASYALARDGFSVTALEPDPSGLVGGGAIRSLAQETGLPITVEDRVSGRLPFDDQSFDVIYARAVLHHIADLRLAMSEFFRVLRPGGRFLAVREHVITEPSDLPAFLDSHPLHHRYGGENAHQVHVYQAAILSAGFILQRTIGSLDSPINFGPQTVNEVHQRIAERVGLGASVRPFAVALMGLPGVGSLVRRVASKIDQRPGRHASFVIRRPL